MLTVKMKISNLIILWVSVQFKQRYQYNLQIFKTKQQIAKRVLETMNSLSRTTESSSLLKSTYLPCLSGWEALGMFTSQLGEGKARLT